MLTGLAGEFDEGMSERGIKDEFQVFSLNNWLNDSVIYWANGRTNLGEVNSQEFYLDNIKLELDDIPWWLRWQRICLQCKRPRLDPWVEKIPWRRGWLLTPVFLPGKSHGHRNLVGYSPWACKESDTTEQLTHTHTHTPELEMLGRQLSGCVKLAVEYTIWSLG